MISKVLAAALEARRSDFNGRFRLAAQRYPQLDGQELLRFVAECIDPLIRAVHERVPAATTEVLTVAYDCALQLTGQRLTLESGRFQAVPATWRELLPAAAGLVAECPALMIPALSNAAHQLAGSGEDGAQRWKARMLQVVSVCGTAEEYLRAGQVIAWQCGLAHYREGALAAFQQLPTDVAGKLLHVAAQQVGATLQRLQSDPWFDPFHAANLGLRVVRHAGGFRGFGGFFIRPPLVRSVAGGWVVQSGGDYWFLIADAFGATLHRASEAEWRAARSVHAEHSGGRLTHGTRSLDLNSAGAITSSALSGQAVACSFAHSHQIALIALQ